MWRDIEFHTHTKQQVKFSFTKSIIVLTYFNRRMTKILKWMAERISQVSCALIPFVNIVLTFFTDVPKKLNLATSHSKGTGVYERNVWFIRAVVQHPLRIQRELLASVVQAFVLLTSPAFPRIACTSRMLSNDTSRLRFNATPNE
jgi:hypothetical protein